MATTNQHHVIAEVERDVEGDIARSAAVPAPHEPARIRKVATDLRSAALDDVVRTDRAAARARIVTGVERVLDYGFFVVYGLLALRFFLALVGARAGAGFTRFVTTITNPPYAPFRNIVEGLRLGDGHVIVLSLVVAVVAYGLLHVALRGLLALVVRRDG